MEPRTNKSETSKQINSVGFVNLWEFASVADIDQVGEKFGEI